MLPKRRLGRQGPDVSAFSIGSWAIWDRMYFDEGVAFIRSGFERGLNFYDIGVYGIYAPPEWRKPTFTDVIFGQLLRASGLPREEIIISEKVWPMVWPQERLSLQIDKALARLGYDYVDVLTVYDNHDPHLDMRGFVQEMGEIIASGRARCWGFNNWSADEVRAAIAYARMDGLPAPQFGQLRYSIARRAIAEGAPYGELFEKEGLAMQASYVLEGGYLAGRTAADIVRPIGGDTADVRKDIAVARPRLEIIAAEVGASLSQLALAFCFTHPATASVLMGASSVSQLHHNLDAYDIYLRHGEHIKQALTPFGFDKGRVDPNAAWDLAPWPFPQP